MNIQVSKHAVKRYRERLFDYASTEALIISELKKIARKGKGVHVRPGVRNSCKEIKFKEISIVVIDNGDDRWVVTCLGDAAYRKWIKNIDAPLKVSGRTLFDRLSSDSFI